MYISQKYNKEGNNNISVILVDDSDDCQLSKGGWNESRKQLKQEKDDIRDLETRSTSLFSVRGLILDIRIQIIKVIQFEDSKSREDMKD